MSILQSVSNNVLGLFNEEPEVARCLVFGETALGFAVPDPASGSSDRHLQFDAPGVADGCVPIVLFQSTPDGEASFSVRLNSTPHLVQLSVDGGGPHSWHKLAPAGSLRPTQNELVFAVSDGRVTFSDVAILYTSNQLTIRKRRPVVATE